MVFAFTPGYSCTQIENILHEKNCFAVTGIRICIMWLFAKEKKVIYRHVPAMGLQCGKLYQEQHSLQNVEWQ